MFRKFIEAVKFWSLVAVCCLGLLFFLLLLAAFVYQPLGSR